MTADVVILAEDPGAAAYVDGVPEALRRGSRSVRLLAAGHAAEALAREKRRFEPVNDAAAALAILRAEAPKAIAVGTSEDPRAIGLGLIEEGRRRGIATIGLVDGPANAAYRFRGISENPLRHAPDWTVVPDEATRDDYVALGMAAERVRACGHPRRDILYAMRDAEPPRRAAQALRTQWLAGRERPLLLFAAELSAGLDERAYRRAPDYALLGISGAEGRTEIVLEELLLAVAALDPLPCVVLRLHPKTPRNLYADYLDAFDAVSEKESAAEAILAADLVVGLTSVILDEALILGRAAVSIVPRASEASWLVGARLGLVPVIAERAAIAPGLRRALAGEDRPSRERVEALLPRGAAEKVARLIADALELRAAA